MELQDQGKGKSYYDYFWIVWFLGLRREQVHTMEAHGQTVKKVILSH